MKPPVAMASKKKSSRQVSRFALSLRFSLAVVSFLYTAVHDLITPQPSSAVVRQYTFS
jgi:hypothetical protein